MEIQENIPIVLFDNECYLCTKFAKIISFFARDKITIIGHYSRFGEKIRGEILDETALNMFWLINEKKAYGGRAALFPLVKSILFEKRKKTSDIRIEEGCKQDCKTVKAVFVRSTSLITNSKTIDLSKSK